MADPLSIAGLGLAVVSLGFQVSGGIITYIDGLKCRDDDIASVRQQNDSLQKTLDFINSSLSRLQHDHQDATLVVHDYLQSCEHQLSALQSHVTNLTAYNQASTSRKINIKNQGKKLLYPFSRPKIEQLEKRICNVNATLRLALQTLGLSVSQSGTQKMAALETISHNISSRLLVVHSNISAMNTPLRGIQSTVSGLETRFDALESLVSQMLVGQPAKNGSSQRISPALATSRLLGKPGVLREICDAAETQAAVSSSEALLTTRHDVAQLGSHMQTYAAGRFSCLCSHRQRLHRNNTMWGSLTFSFETATEQHLPGCPAGQLAISASQSQKLSFTMSWGAGAWSLSPNFIYYPTVNSETAPAFRLLTLLHESATSGSLGGESSLSRWEKFSSSVGFAILRLLQANKVSPRAVDHRNRSLVHVLSDCIVTLASSGTRRLPIQDKPSPLLDLLQCLLANKSPANEYDLFGHTSLGTMFLYNAYSSVTDPLPAAAAELILQANVDANMASLSSPAPVYRPHMIYRSGRQIRASGTEVLLHFLSCSSRIAEAYGCGPLSVAVLSNNLEQVEHLLHNHPATLHERNIFGHTPLHLAADKPLCLRLLVKAADIRLLNDTHMKVGSIFQRSALEIAVETSGSRCRESSRLRICRRCTCAESAVILLQADCALPVPAYLQEVLENASRRCKLRFMQHMKNRRDRLKQLALNKLPAPEVEQLSLEPDRVLDSSAPRAVQLLQNRDIYIPEALVVAREKPLSVYQELEWPWDAELFFRAGFRDIDSSISAREAELNKTTPMRKKLPYLHWLATHGVISCQLRSFASTTDIFMANYTFWSIAEDLMEHSEYRLKDTSSYLKSRHCVHSALGEWLEAPPLDDRRAWVHDLHATALPVGVADSCCCRCSPEGCTPLTSLLKRVTYRYPGWQSDFASNWSTVFAHYLTLFGDHLDVRHHAAALRFLTWSALEITHTCCHPHYRRCEIDAAEFEDEFVYELTLLGELMREFEGEVVTIFEDPGQGIDELITFWRTRWVSRIQQVLSDLEGNELDDDERRRAEEIGVVWDKPRSPPPPPEVTDNPYEKDDLAYWMYELKKIEAECW